jgi:hypothetical protein
LAVQTACTSTNGTEEHSASVYQKCFGGIELNSTGVLLGFKLENFTSTELGTTLEVAFTDDLGKEDEECANAKTDRILIKQECDFSLNSSKVLIPLADFNNSATEVLPVVEYRVCIAVNKSALRHSPFVKAKPMFTPVGNKIIQQKRLISILSTNNSIVSGLRIETGGGKGAHIDDNGVATVLANDETVLRLFGLRLKPGEWDFFVNSLLDIK